MGLEFVKIPLGRTMDVEEGVQTSLFELDQYGIPKVVITNRQHVQHGHTNTGWKPDIDAYTIEERVYGSLKPLNAHGKPTGAPKVDKNERRKLTYDKTTTPKFKYYINDVLQGYVPTPTPDPAVVILLKDKAVIGFPDVLEDRLFFEAREIVKP